MERGWKPYVEMSPTCPRCGSLNTKFCYYNNYSLTQPRYFCKGCRRYWTKGGSLRNVPVGGGCRKTRRAKAVRAARHGLSFRSNPSPCGNLTGPIESNATSSNIDLAVVYANFLNQHPQPAETNQLEILPPLPNANHHPFEFVNVGGMEFGAQLSHENCTTLSDWSLDTIHSKDLLYMCGLDSGHKQHDITSTTCDDHNISAYELPPLPGEELVPSADMIMWSNSNDIVVNHEDTLHGTPQLLGLGPEADHDQGHELMGSRSMFGLLNYGTNSTRP